MGTTYTVTYLSALNKGKGHHQTFKAVSLKDARRTAIEYMRMSARLYSIGRSNDYDDRCFIYTATRVSGDIYSIDGKMVWGSWNKETEDYEINYVNDDGSLGDNISKRSPVAKSIAKLKGWGRA